MRFPHVKKLVSSKLAHKIQRPFNCNHQPQPAAPYPPSITTVTTAATMSSDEEDVDSISEEEVVEKPKRRRKKKKNKDPNRPKRNMSAFFLYSNANRPRIKEENPDAKFGDIVSASCFVRPLPSHAPVFGWRALALPW